MGINALECLLCTKEADEVGNFCNTQLPAQLTVAI